jgi:hypothetical protein
MVTLFKLEREDIKISMEIYFNDKGQLYFDGYDIGKSVEDYWGDSDYEYTYTVEPAEIEKFYTIFNLKSGDRKGLLQEIKKRFSVNEAYSLFGKFMDDHKIKYESFTWT